MIKNIARRSWLIYIFAFLAGYALLSLLNPGLGRPFRSLSSASSSSSGRHASGSSLRGERAEAYRDDIGFLPTRILAHVPGYTVLENAYWQDGQVRIYSEEPWSFPDVNDIARHETLDHISEVVDVKIIHVLDKRWSYDNDPIWLKFDHILLEEMQVVGPSATEIPGSTFACADMEFIDHYYHFVELFFPMWKVLTKALERHPYHSSLTPWIHNLVFWNADPEPKDIPGQPRLYRWQDRAGVNKMLMEKAFPGINLSAKDTWIPRAQSGELYRFPILMLASRKAGHGGPNSSYKPFGDALRLPIGTADWWSDIKERILSDHVCDYPAPSPEKPVITYLSRQTTGRRLTDRAHEAVIEELEAIAKTGKAEYRYEVFENTPIPEQWARIARTTIFLAVHGNGLTHIIFLPALPGSAVFEMQPEHCQINDYAPFALFRNVSHWIVQNDHQCAPTECKTRGCYEGDVINSDAIEVDARMLGNNIRAQLGIPKRV